MITALTTITKPALTGEYSAEAQLFLDEHFDYIGERFTELLNDIEHTCPADAADIRALLDELDVSTRQALIMSPEMQWILYFRKDCTLEAVIAFMVAHLEREGRPLITGTDIQLRTDTGHNVVTMYMSEAFQRLGTLPCSEVLQTKLAQAFALIKAVSPSWFRFINDIQTECYAYSHPIPDQQHLSSGSFRGLNGAFFIHASDDVTVEALADAIVHEAVHTAIYLWEHRYEPLIHKDDSSTLIPSPWTGNPLSKDNLIQAIFVWAGLLRFWSLPAHHSENARALRNKAQSGFATPGVEQFILANTDVIHQDALSCYLTLVQPIVSTPKALERVAC
jgi:hypothetical protein